MKIKLDELRDSLANILDLQTNPFSLFLILILLLQVFGEPNGLAKILRRLFPEGPKGGGRMMIPLMSEKDMSLLKAFKPFLSVKSQGMLDVMMTVLNVFKPLQEGKGVDVDALATLMDMVQTSQQSKQMAKKSPEIEVVDDFVDPPDFHSETKDLENLLTLLSEKSADEK